MVSGKVVNAMTVDVEDYFHVSGFSRYVEQANWEKYECRVEANTRKLLELFDKYDVRATFFVLGWVAERFPNLVREIAKLGHEIACHGYSHKLIYEQTPDEFRRETVKAKTILEDIIQDSVLGYRAASYSIVNSSLWALDILVECGFSYDSSIFPIHHDRYGISNAELFPHKLTTPSGHKLIEFPLSTVRFLATNVPIAGGGYFRLFPYHVTKTGLAHINRRNRPFIFYLHPWEVDPDQPRVAANWKSRFRHYNNLNKCEKRLEKLVSEFTFSTAQHVLSNQGLLDTSSDKLAFVS
ncbi:MAG: DUF3473 domain-containing protein [Gammaproteobacteria bacterium]|nr:DUF3473 domain-containing protein [Gammaproteobacteria bacterium]